MRQSGGAYSGGSSATTGLLGSNSATNIKTQDQSHPYGVMTRNQPRSQSQALLVQQPESQSRPQSRQIQVKNNNFVIENHQKEVAKKTEKNREKVAVNTKAALVKKPKAAKE